MMMSVVPERATHVVRGNLVDVVAAVATVDETRDVVRWTLS